jgi:response regulator of citrate/malate metabolism
MTHRILIIDDDLSFKKIVEMRLKAIMPDASVTHFASLTEVRANLRTPESQDFDLIVIDQHLPDGRGSELLAEGWFRDKAILSVSSDNAPEIPGATVQAGATFFLSKRSVSEPLFKPLILGIIDRNRLSKELEQAKLNQAVIDTVKTLVGTLRHEINNPLGAVLGAAYLLSTAQGSTPEQKEAAELVESSGKRIKHVLEQLCKAVELDSVNKANQKVFHIPGDKAWETKK